MTEQEKLQLELELLQLEEEEARNGAAQPAAESRPGQAALEGFGETATMGYLPQLQAAASKPIYAAMNAVTGQDVQPDSYLEERDANLRRQRELAESNPGATMVGKAAGIGATMLAPMGAAKSLGQAVKQGAAMGAIYNPGDVEGVVDPAQGGDRLRNFLIGGAGGAAGYGLAKGVQMLGTPIGARAQYKEAQRMAQNPDLTRQQAQELTNRIARELPEKEAASVAQTLRGKTAQIDPSEFSGLTPETSSIMSKYAREVPTEIVENSGAARMTPVRGSVDMPLEDVWAAAKDLSKTAKVRTPFGAQVDQPLAMANENLFNKSQALRGKLKEAGGLDTVEAFERLSDAIGDAQAAQRTGRFNVSNLYDPEDINKLGLLRHADKELGTNSAAFANRLGQAEELLKKGITPKLGVAKDVLLDEAVKRATQAPTSGLGGVVNRAAPMGLEAFLEGLRKK